jgi:hypothetical protein
MEQRLTEFSDRVRPLTKGLTRCESCEDSGSVVGAVLGIRSAEELSAELAGLAAAEEKKRQSLHAHATNITDLARLLRHHSDDLARLKMEEARLREILELKQRQKAENAEASLEQLCVWYRSMIESVSDLTRMKFEMIRPDYILVTFKTSEANKAEPSAGDSGSKNDVVGSEAGSTEISPPDNATLPPTTTTLPVHLNIDPQTGRLLAAQIGTTQSAGADAWRGVCEQAVENNDICSLLHAIQLRI